MAEEIANTAPAPAASPTESVVSPPSSSEAAPSPVEKSSVETAPVSDGAVVKAEPVVTEAPKTEDAAKPEDTTVLGADKAPEGVEEKPEEVKPTESEKVPEEAISLPTYEDFTLPEGVTLDKEQVGKFNTMLGEFENTTKASHEEVQKFGQKALDTYIAEMQDVTNRLHEGYRNSWNKQKSDWFNEFKNDPEIGGNRFETTSTQVRNAIETYGGTAEQKAEFRKLMRDTGIGNAPPLIRTFNYLASEINRLKQKYESESGAENSPKQLAGTKPVGAQVKSKIEKRYGSV